METTRVDVRLPDELLEKTDVAAEVTHENRTEVIEEALREYLENVEDDEAFKKAVVKRYLDDQIGFELLSEWIGQRTAESVRASESLLDPDDDLTDELADL